MALFLQLQIYSHPERYPGLVRRAKGPIRTLTYLINGLGMEGWFATEGVPKWRPFFPWISKELFLPVADRKWAQAQEVSRRHEGIAAAPWWTVSKLHAVTDERISYARDWQKGNMWETHSALMLLGTWTKKINSYGKRSSCVTPWAQFSIHFNVAGPVLSWTLYCSNLIRFLSNWCRFSLSTCLSVIINGLDSCHGKRCSLTAVNLWLELLN